MTTAPGRVASPSVSTRGIAYHETLAAGWTQRYAGGGFKRRADFFIEAVLPKALVGGDWIDVGCGSGFFSRVLAERGAKVVGFDGSPAMIEAARATATAKGTTEAPRYDVMAIEDLAAVKGSFDGAICLSVIEYVENPRAAIAAIAGLVKPGGRLLLSAPNRHSSLRRLQRMLRGAAAAVGSKAFPYMESSRNLWSSDELVALLESEGFAREAILGFDPVAPKPLWGLLSPSLWFVIGRKREKPAA
jgi:2-polyprenyl-6-hydroxyphenyl methylase/3-demethylubiquinone-9 3-methyltransferase